MAHYRLFRWGKSRLEQRLRISSHDDSGGRNTNVTLTSRMPGSIFGSLLLAPRELQRILGV